MSPNSLSLLVTIFAAAVYSVHADTETFVFGGCSQVKYAPGTSTEQAVNSILTSVVNNAMFTSYNNFTVLAPASVSGVFQCRGDLPGDACGRCVTRAVSQLGSLCADACGGVIQLEGCFVKYDNRSFLGVSDKTLVVKKCGSLPTADGAARVDGVLSYLGGGGGAFRVGGTGNVQGVAQCVGDLSASECQDCISEAVQRLKTDCGPTSWGDVYLAKCFARFSDTGFASHAAAGGSHKDENNDEDEIEKTLAILIGLIAGVGLLIVFLSFLRKLCESGEKGGK